MRKIVVLLIIGTSLFGIQLLGYRKCCYADYPFSESMAPLKTVVQSMPLDKQEPAYTFACGDDISCRVYLHDGDKLAIKRELSNYDRSRVINSENVLNFSRKHKSRSRVVGLILDDFRRSNAAATVQDLFVALGIDRKEGEK